MQVMDAKPPEPPLAELVGLQFGLATTNDFVGFSVIKPRSQDSLSALVDPRLGLPAEDEKCATCGGTNYEECAGHFAHVNLSQPIFHPNHMRLLLRILQKVCLACGKPRVKKKKSTFGVELHHRKQSYGESSLSEAVNEGRNHPAILEAEPVKRRDAGGHHDVIEISSDDDDDEIAGILRVAYEPVGPGSTSQSSQLMAIPRLESSKSKGKAHANGSSHFEVPADGSKKYASMKSQFTQSPGESSGKVYKGRPSGLDVLDVDTLKTAKSSGSTSGPCKHCFQPVNPAYRPIDVKILPMKGRKKDHTYEILLLKVQPSKKEDDPGLPDDFWAFLHGPAHHTGQTKHVLSPSEALSILKKVPVRAIGRLGMNRLVAQPKALILQSVPIPPNCTRTADYKYVSNTDKVRFGSDNVTRALQNLVNEIVRIHKTRSGPAMYKAQRDESTSLQILTAEYLREKGAPDAVSGTEPLKKDRNGRVMKQDIHRWTKAWFSEHLLAKGGNYTAKAVIVGDPSINIEEIGVPWDIAQKLTLPVKASRWNCAELQEYVDRSQTLESTGSGKPSAARIERNGEAFQVFPNSTHKVEIGDVIHRNIQDGDYVYVNRPPSVHKHSLIALKVRIHYGLVMTVNPLICSPFGADFDGDTFHIYIPQSIQAIAEVQQLMAVPHQLVSDHGGQPLLGLTQDTLLAAHLLTTSKIFVDKATMDQLCLWSSKQPPQGAILKSPKGGPYWTGEQVFGLTLPAQLNMCSTDGSIIIQGGEITKWNGSATNMLRKDKEGIASVLCAQLGPMALVEYLNNATELLLAWLQAQGFSTGLVDFQITHKPAARQIMHQRILQEYFQNSIQESVIAVHILDPQQVMMNPEDLTKDIGVLEQAALEIFRARELDAEKIIMEYAEKDNPLLLMVKSGSKGSRGKLLQQVAGMGLQLYKGRHLVPLSSVRRPSVSNDPMLDWWKNRGLVRSSLLDGLKPTELFNHVVADRTGIFRKHIEVTQPGTLFKSLMLFLRDLHVAYDGSVRSQSGKNIIQLCYGGAEGLRGPSGVWEEDDQKRWNLSRLAGEPVGVLAATAVSQPAYEVMLDAPSLSGPSNPRPLDLLQETLYPREKADLKPIDRYAIIRLEQCICTRPFCLEKTVLAVQAFLTKIPLRELAQSVAITYWNMEDNITAGPYSGDALDSGSPWLGHIKLSLDLMQQQKVAVEDILQRLREKYSAIFFRSSKKDPIGQIFFCSSLNCSVSHGCCLHFSPRLPKKLQNEHDDDVYNDALLALLMKIRATIIPALLDCTVKGDERIESVRIVHDGPTRTTWHHNLIPSWGNDHDEELVLEILVSPTKPKSDRSLPWTAVKEACVPFMNLVDWNRSMPYSIQQIRHSLGIEAACEMVTKRLRLVFEKTAPHTHHDHAKLIADAMTYSGTANGFTIYGFQDMIKSTAVSAPFTEASFRKPIRTLLDAAGRGAKDSVEGVMTSCVWGKEAPLGTGSKFDVFWQPATKEQRRVIGAEKDVHEMWRDLDEKCIPDRMIPLSPPPQLPSLRVLPEEHLDLDDGAGFSPQRTTPADDTWDKDKNEDDGVWVNSPVARKDGGGWGDGGTASNGGGWDQDDSVKEQGEQGAWGSQNITLEESGGAGNGGGWNDQGDGSVEDRVVPPNGDDGLKNKQINLHGGQNSAICPGGWDEGNSSAWGTDPVQAETGDWNALSPDVAARDGPNALQQPHDKDEEADVDWGELISGVKKADVSLTTNHSWASSAALSAGDDWDKVPVPEKEAAGVIRPGATHNPSGAAMSHTLRQHGISEPECKEIDDTVKSMRKILTKNYVSGGTRLSAEDDEAVQAVLAYHPSFKEKAGCGVAYIKVDKSQEYSASSCFWVVRTDGSETDFSYHKCLKEKVAREFPAFAPDWYDNLYRGRRSAAPARLGEEPRPDISL